MQTTTAPIKHRIFSQSKVLLLESDRNNSIYLVDSLKLLNCDCLIASDTMLALSLAQQEQPDSILIDLQMPQINGVELLKILRIDWLTRDIPIIAITTSIAIDQAVLEAEFDDYLLKPYTRKDLQKAIANNFSNAIAN